MLARLGALLVDASRGIDRAYRLFDSARSAIIARWASDGLLHAYNDRAYARTAVYRPDSPHFRSTLFNWEADAIEQWFPAPPARVLVGGAGGGREPLALSDLGYHVTAFEPSRALATRIPQAAGTITAYAGRYEDLPIVRSLDEGQPIDLRRQPPFDAGILGWTSYSHLRTSAARIAALRKMAELVRGPILVSFYAAPPAGAPAGLAQLAKRAHLWSPHDRFTPIVGYYHLSTRDELYEECDRAGVTVAHYNDDGSDGRWPFCIVHRSNEAGGE